MHTLPHVDWRKWDKLLGTTTDTRLAKQIGCSRSLVTMRRLTLGVAPCQTATLRKGWTEQQIAKLGTESDERVAEMLRRSVRSVALMRRKLGIPPCHPETDNRGLHRNPIDILATAPIRAAVARARRIGLGDDQIVYVFGALLRPRRVAARVTVTALSTGLWMLQALSAEGDMASRRFHYANLKAAQDAAKKYFPRCPVVVNDER